MRILKKPVVLSDFIDENGHLVIPEGTVKIPKRAFSDCENLRSVVVPTSVTTIGDFAFCGCRNLAFIDIPEGVTTIGCGAFLGCSGLTSIVIPASVTTIDSVAFAECAGLASIGVAPGNRHFLAEGDCLLSEDGSTLVFGCKTSVIPDSVTTIGPQAFRGCSDLSSIVLPQGIETIGYAAFSGCVGLIGIDIPSGMKSIDSYAFAGCTGLTGIVLPGGLTSVGTGAFQECSGLVRVVIPQGITEVDEWTFFSCTSLADVTLPDGMTWIGDYAFRCCTSLKRIEIPQGVTVIGRYAFSDCTGLERVGFPESLTTIQEGAFSGCTSLPDDAIPEGVVVQEEDDDYYVDWNADEPVMIIETTALVSGPKKTIVDIINKALAIIGSKKIVVGLDDGVETINLKIKEANDVLEEYGADFTLMDFLDDYNRMHSPCKDYVLSYIDEEEPDGSEDYGITLGDAKEKGDEYSVEIGTRLYYYTRSYESFDWWDWCERMVRIYGCRILVKRIYSYANVPEGEDAPDGCDERFFEPDGASVKQIVIQKYSESEPARDPVQESEPKPQTEEPEDGLPF